MSQQPWGPVVERRKAGRYVQQSRFAQPGLASPFITRPRKPRRASLRNPSLAVDLIAFALFLSLAFAGVLLSGITQ